MKLLFISPAFYPATYYGGPIYSTYGLAKALNRQNVDVNIITTNANGNERLKLNSGVFHNLENELQVKYYDSLDSRGTSLSMLFNLRREIKNAEIVYLISIFSAPTPLTIFLCRLFKKPLIISPKGQLGKWCLEQGNRFKKLWLCLFIQPYVKRLQWHLTSAEEEKDVLAIYPRARTFVIPNGVSSELFSMNDKKKNKSFYSKYSGFDCSDKKIVISMGRLQKVKGFDILIEAVSNVRGSMLFIAGEDFGERKNLEKLIDKLGLKEKVFLIGKIEGFEKIELLRSADVFALASHHENFGMVYAEALAAGTPVVASTKTPWQDVEKNNCGKWVENTPDKFAEAINEILNSDTVQMGINGISIIRDNYDWNSLSKNFLNNVEQILNGK